MDMITLVNFFIIKNNNIHTNMLRKYSSGEPLKSRKDANLKL